jgi:hypothetical protein
LEHFFFIKEFFFEFTLIKENKSRVFPIYLSKNSEISPGKKYTVAEGGKKHSKI